MHLILRASTVGLVALVLAACAAPPVQAPAAGSAPAVLAEPRAEQRPHDVVSPHGTRVDEYYWLRDDTRQDPAVLAYLEAENRYAEHVLAPLAPAQQLLYDEIVGRIRQDDASVPAFEDGWWYYSRFETGSDYPVYARRKGSMDASEEVLLDGNMLAAGNAYWRLGWYEVSPDGSLLAWTDDRVGRNQYTLRFKRIADGVELPQVVDNVQPGFGWSAGGVVYVERDPVTLLGYKVKVHAPGAGGEDRLIHEETDRSFYLGVWRSRSDRFLMLRAQSTVSAEVRVADADDPEVRLRVLLPRERDHDYDVEDHGDRWIIRSNWQAPNYRIASVPMADVADRARWQDVIAHRDDAFVEGFQVFDRFLAVGERSSALRNVRIRQWVGGAERLVDADDAAYALSLGINPEPSATDLQYVYESFNTPESTYRLDVATGERSLLKRDPVLGAFSPDDYDSALVWAPARDGARIPVTLVHRRGVPRDGSAPLMLFGYGSYGYSRDPGFDVARLSLLDRGVVFAIAHVRGGQELGRRWYDQGRLLNKKNTFTDFIDVADHLVAEGWAARGRIVAVGGSAGGLLMGAIANMAPDRWAAILSYVPFVDVVTTMLDESIPLTTNEFDEWGNPKQKEYYDYMLSYSPYDQLSAQAYPAMLVRTGLWDSQVQYFEPAKYVARLRARRTNDAPLVFKTQMQAGHSGRSGRFERYRDTALDYAFALDRLGVAVDALAAPAERPARAAAAGGAR
jgi:oligopeptidase B